MSWTVLFLCALAYYLVCLGWVIGVARRAPIEPSRPGWALVFGKRILPNRVDPDFSLRVSRAQTLIHHPHLLGWVFLGGGRVQGLSEAKQMHDYLCMHLEGKAFHLDEMSINTYENLRNAPAGLPQEGVSAILLSSRYHLARCSLLAKRQKMSHEVVGAEDRLHLTRHAIRILAVEAVYFAATLAGTAALLAAIHRRKNRRLTCKPDGPHPQ